MRDTPLVLDINEIIPEVRDSTISEIVTYYYNMFKVDIVLIDRSRIKNR